MKGGRPEYHWLSTVRLHQTHAYGIGSFGTLTDTDRKDITFWQRPALYFHELDSLG